MRNRIMLTILSVLILFIGCADTKSHSTSVYMLMDTSGTYTNQLDQAQSIINYLLGKLQSGDSFAVARVDSSSFSEKDIVAKMTFDQRPSVANKQKLMFKKTVEDFIKNAKGSKYTDITGGILQAVDYIKETGAGNKHILIFSDMVEDLPKGYTRDLDKIDLNLTGYRVVALNVIKLGSDQVDPAKYYERLEHWETIIKDRGGTWEKIGDLKRPEKLINK